MGKSRATLNKSASSSSNASSLRSGKQRFSSSSDLWPEVAPEESNRRAAHRKKSLSTSRDQLLYLQALFPYAAYDELMSVITKTDGPDEAAQYAYEALNPNYTGYLYLKEQTDVLLNAKAGKARRATAFAGVKESLEERAADAFRPGMFSNLSQLQEYHETVGLFAVDTTEWDRAMLLPARDLAEMAFTDLPLREEPSSRSSSSSSSAREGREHHRTTRGSDQHNRHRLLPQALTSRNARFMDASFVKQSRSSMDATLHSAPASREKRGNKPRDGCRTPIASAASHERDSYEQPHSSIDLHTAGLEDTGVLYLQDSDPEHTAPVIAWAPEAIRVGPAEALRQQEGALRVFDEATFFNDPLLARQPSPAQLQTPDTRPAQAPQSIKGSCIAATSPPFLTAAEASVEMPPLLAVSPNLSPRAAVEHHEPIDNSGDSLPIIADEEEEDYGEAEEEGDEEGDGASKNGAVESSPSLHQVAFPTVTVICDPALCGAPDNAAEHSLNFPAKIHVDTSSHIVLNSRMRESTLDKLKSRKRRPITSYDKVKQRMRKLKPVGNLVFRENGESSATVAPLDNVFAEEGRPTSTTSRLTRLAPAALESTLRTEDDIYTSPSARTQKGDWTTRESRCNEDGPAPPLPGVGAHVFGSAAAAAASVATMRDGAAPRSAPVASGSRDRVQGQPVQIPAAHPGCSSLDPAAYLNAEEERWSSIVEVLKPFEDVFGVKFRCELVRCVYDDCRAIRTRLTEILQRLLYVVGQVMQGKEVAEGFYEEPMNLPLFGAILLSTSPIKLEELTFRKEKCVLNFCEQGTRLRVKLDVKKVKFEPIQFAYIDEADAARQNRAAQQSRRKMSQPRSRAAEWTLRQHNPEKYKNGITRGSATITVADVKLKGIVYVWLMASGKVYVTFQEAKVSVGSFSVSTDVSKLNALFTLGSPILKLFVKQMLLDCVKGVHIF